MFGIEITLDDPAAGARAELAELKQMLATVEAGLKAAMPAQPSPAQPSPARRLVETIKGVFGSRPGAAAPAQEPAALSPEAARVMAADPLFLDYETTGLNKRTDRVVEVCVLDSRGRVVFSTLVNPQRAIPPHISALNGIYDSDVADAPTWRQIEPLLRQALAGRRVVAHNAPFEAKFTPFEVDWVCSKDLADAALGKADWWEAKQDWRKGGSLVARLRQCGLPAAQQHTAAGDCLGALRLMKHLAGDASPVELKYNE